MKLLAPLAVRYGYDVQVFAPGEAYSGTINPLDFMRDAQDAVMAAEIGQVIARNASPGESKGNEFFEKAGELMAKGLVQLAKSKSLPGFSFCVRNYSTARFGQAHRPRRSSVRRSSPQNGQVDCL